MDWPQWNEKKIPEHSFYVDQKIEFQSLINDALNQQL
jgi:hypothetical protein